MQTSPSHLAPQNKAMHSPALIKLRATALSLKLATAAYAAWVLWAVLNWWLSPNQVIEQMSRYLGQDLHGLATWQRMVPLALDLIAWAFLCGAVVYAWRFLSDLESKKVFSKAGANAFMRCAWLAIACEGFTQLTRPVIHYVLTAHLNADQQAFHWPFRPSDLQSIILCLVLLVSALIYTWAIEIAEENKEFV